MTDDNDKKDELDEELQQSLKAIVEGFEIDERATRERQIRLWKKLEYYWAGFTRIWWDDVARDWRLPGDDRFDDNENESAYYDKQINVYRAYLESIIAALSTTVPSVKFFPDDADVELDVLTAKGASKIADLIYKHNDAELLWVRALYVYCTQGMIAAYQRSVEDDKFGKVALSKFENQEEESEIQRCPRCKAYLTVDAFQLADQETNEYDPDDDDAESHNDLSKGKILCPNCMVQVDPELSKEKFIVPRLVGITNQAKSRQLINIEGGLYVFVPNWARCQEDTPILGYSYETHYVNVLKCYPHLRDKGGIEDGSITGIGGVETYARWGRLNPQYYGEYPQRTPTVRHFWLRPHAFEAENDKDRREKLYKKFPDGCHATWVNEEFAEAENQDLDDHWTLTFNPLSEFIHFDPLGLLLTSIQELTQDLFSLTIQTIEHGVPQVFADPSVLNFNQYGQSEIAPGSIVSAKAKTGKALGDGFFTIQTATLSQEVEPFQNQVQSMGQFVSGALPSIWGGAEAGGTSRTAAQASMSRNQALQRLQNTWKMLNSWWAKIFAKAVPAYIKDMLDDERIVTQQYGCFVNDFIRRAEVEGKLGQVEPEASDQLPQTWGQIKDTIMQLFQLNNPVIMSALTYPENVAQIQKAIGLDDFEIPGENDRQKQYYEINLMLQSGPIPGQPDPNNPQAPPQDQSSIQPEPDVDNHQIEAEICKNWLVSEAGILAKTQNPDGYQNILLHMQAHMNIMQQQQMQQQQQPNQSPGPQGPPPNPKNSMQQGNQGGPPQGAHQGPGQSPANMPQAGNNAPNRLRPVGQ